MGWDIYDLIRRIEKLEELTLPPEETRPRKAREWRLVETYGVLIAVEDDPASPTSPCGIRVREVLPPE